MAYTAEIGRANPTSCSLFVIDQSGSMGNPFAGGGRTLGRSKAQELADVTNRLLKTLSLAMR